ncbi:hypothetical protein [Pseudoflavonifractor gallinarum]|uniref:hypothetical protein n=1 Tax=Pseudoflavonifractor gallinarum TaxID=2779352 RepID=UPI0036F2E134
MVKEKIRAVKRDHDMGRTVVLLPHLRGAQAGKLLIKAVGPHHLVGMQCPRPDDHAIRIEAQHIQYPKVGQRPIGVPEIISRNLFAMPVVGKGNLSVHRLYNRGKQIGPVCGRRGKIHIAIHLTNFLRRGCVGGNGPNGCQCLFITHQGCQPDLLYRKIHRYKLLHLPFHPSALKFRKSFYFAVIF